MKNDPPEGPEEDAQGLDIETRIRNLKSKVEALTGREASWEVDEDCPAELEEEFWKNVIAFESARWVQPYQVLVGGGISLPSASELDDQDLTAKLWELIESLAMLGVFLHNTNHLSDRELYSALVENALKEEAVLAPGNPDCAFHIDILGSGNEQDTFLYLKFYADQEYRNHWATQWPDDEIPDQEDPPFDRDRHLPQASF
jgi:hypothetical protein